MADAATSPLAVIGAGRWARELVRTLRALEPRRPVLMYSGAHADALRAQLAAEAAFAGVEVTASFEELARFAPAAAIIANAARDHARAVEWALQAGVPALVEKPFTDRLADTRRLVERARRDGTLLCAAHVLMFADYLPAFAARLAAAPAPRAISVDWCDPRAEVRYGERKRFDAGVPVYLDCLPHVVSVLRVLWPGRALVPAGLEFARGGAQLHLRARLGDCALEIRLERNATARRRVIAVASAAPVTLDFSQEPGFILKGAAQESADTQWQSRPRPMAAMLDAFLQAVGGKGLDARLDADVAVRAAELIEWAAPIYNARRLQWLDATLAARGPDDEDVSYALAEILSTRGAPPPDLLDEQMQRMHEQFRVSRDAAWLATLAGARDPASILDLTAASNPH